MKKFNEEMYKEIKKNGTYKDNYYTYIVINDSLVYNGYTSNWLNGSKYEFYGIIDKAKKDIYTLANAEEIQNDLLEEVRQEIKKEIEAKEINYMEIQQKNFNTLINNEDFKRGILYRYTGDYNSAFSDLFVKGTTPEEFKSDLLNKYIIIKGINSENFLKQFIIEDTTSIKEQIKKNYYNGEFLDKWNFNYNWNNESKNNLNIDFTFNNEISLNLNKINFIVAEYKKIFDNPNDQLKKSKELYNNLKEFKDTYKSCNLTLKDGLTLKVIDFSYLVYIFETGKSQAISYRLFTNAERYQLEQYNEAHDRSRRDSDLFIEDIQKIEYSKKVLYEAKECE